MSKSTNIMTDKLYIINKSDINRRSKIYPTTSSSMNLVLRTIVSKTIYHKYLAYLFNFDISTVARGWPPGGPAPNLELFVNTE